MIKGSDTRVNYTCDICGKAQCIIPYGEPPNGTSFNSITHKEGTTGFNIGANVDWFVCLVCGDIKFNEIIKRIGVKTTES